MVMKDSTPLMIPIACVELFFKSNQHTIHDLRGPEKYNYARFEWFSRAFLMLSDDDDEAIISIAWFRVLLFETISYFLHCVAFILKYQNECSLGIMLETFFNQCSLVCFINKNMNNYLL